MSNLKAKSVTQLATKLAKGNVVTFSFVKRNGDLRSAKATTNNQLIPKELRATITNEVAASSLRFFDLGINQWRSVSNDSPVYY
jgi:hypothetical protein